MLIKSNYIGTIARMWADFVSTKFSDSLIELFQFSERKLCKENEHIKYLKAPFSYHELARNYLVDKSEGAWTLFLDTDHTFAPDLLIRLKSISEKYKAPVVSGIYQYKFPPHAPVINLWSNDESPGKKVVPILDWDREAGEIMEVGPVGAGCLYVENWVFKEMRKKFKQAPFEIIPGLSEDYSFCYRLKEMGIPVTLATNIECHHLITTALSIQDYKCSAPSNIID